MDKNVKNKLKKLNCRGTKRSPIVQVLRPKQLKKLQQLFKVQAKQPSPKKPRLKYL